MPVAVGSRLPIVYPSKDPRILFEDDFDGGMLDPARWTITDTNTVQRLVNGDMETGSPPSNWTAQDNVTFTADAVAPHGGSQCGKGVSTADQGTGIYQDITTVAGRQTTISIWLKSEAGSVVGFDVWDGAYATQLGTTTFVERTSWTQVSLVITAQSTSTRISVSCSTNSGHTFYFDDGSAPEASPLITVSGGSVRYSGGLGTPQWADPAQVSKAPYFWARQAGLTIEWQITPTAANTELLVGFTDGSLASNAAEAHGIYLRSTGIISVIMNAATGVVTPYSYSAGQVLWVKIVVLATGALYYLSADNRASWFPIYLDKSVSTSPLYAFKESYNAATAASRCVVYIGSAMLAAIDAVVAAVSLSLGSELLTDPGLEANYTAGKCDTLTNLVQTPTLAESADAHSGSKAQSFISTANGDRVGWANYTPTAGLWYLGSMWSKRIAGSSGQNVFQMQQPGGFGAPSQFHTAASYTQLTVAGRAPNTNGIILWAFRDNTNGGDTILGDDGSLKAVTFSSMLSGGGDAARMYGCFDADVTVGTGHHAGLVFCLDDAATPANYLHIYVDRPNTKAYLNRVTSGAAAVELTSGAITYGAGNKIRAVVVPGSSGLSNARVALYYNGAQVGTTQVVDLSSGYGTLVRAFDTSGAATVDVEVNV